MWRQVENFPGQLVACYTGHGHIGDDQIEIGRSGFKQCKSFPAVCLVGPKRGNPNIITRSGEDIFATGHFEDKIGLLPCRTTMESIGGDGFTSANPEEP